MSSASATSTCDICVGKRFGRCALNRASGGTDLTGAEILVILGLVVLSSLPLAWSVALRLSELVGWGAVVAGQLPILMLDRVLLWSEKRVHARPIPRAIARIMKQPRIGGNSVTGS